MRKTLTVLSKSKLRLQRTEKTLIALKSSNEYQTKHQNDSKIQFIQLFGAKFVNSSMYNHERRLLQIKKE